MINYDDIPENKYSFCSDIVKQYAVNYQDKLNEPVPEDNINKQIRFQITEIFGNVDESTKECLFKRIKHDVDTIIEETLNEGSCLEDKQQNHIDWFDEVLQDTAIKWDHWNFYKHILTSKGTAEQIVAANKVNKETNAILRRLENPNRPGAWDCRGLVVGDVQAGKTSNYVGLLAKAVDVGYKVIIVLAGSTNDLRVQTQQRIDDGLLGYRTSKNGNNGIVQKCKGKTIRNKTSCDSRGDYKKAPTFSTIIGDDCILYVVKKNGSVLRNILDDLYTECNIQHTRLIENAPVLLIDDEADYASPDTKGPKVDPLTGDIIESDDVDPTIINRYIRAILSCFQKSVYIGYTATPYANIFELPNHGKEKEVDDKKLGKIIKIGEDLFPRSFIYKMATPTNYVGIEKVFGIEEDGSDALPLIIRTDEVFPNDFETTITGERRKNIKKTLKDDPESLKYAIRCFIIASIVKDLRMTRVKHNTMLVHIDRLTDKQSIIETWVSDYVTELKDIFTIEGPKVQKRFITSLKNLWESEFCKNFDALAEKLGKPYSAFTIKWEDIELRVSSFISKLTYKTVNGKTLDALDYENHSEGLNVIAIGGDKLARGLTLEGLSISYFLRNAGTYDTLTQMGRWFGYRDGYLDVCRVFTMTQTYNNFREIAIAVHDIYQQFDDLCKQGDRTPMDYGLRVLTNPRSKLLITARNKSKTAIKHAISFSGSPVPTAYLPTDLTVTENNLNVFNCFFKNLSKPTGYASSLRNKGQGANAYWIDVPSSDVVKYFFRSSFVLDKQNSWFSLPEIASFVESVSKKHDEITKWTVVLVNGDEKNIGPIEFNDKSISVFPSRRKLEPMEAGQGYYELNRRRIPSATDEAFDLTESQYQFALNATNEERQKNGKKITDTPNSHYIRLARDKHTALLLLYCLRLERVDGVYVDGIIPGFMISFPEIGYREMDLSFWGNIVYAESLGKVDDTIKSNEVQDD